MRSDPRPASQLGTKLGWLLGGLASLLWLPILSLVGLLHGGRLWPALGFAIFFVGAAYLHFAAPWRHPGTPIRTLYLGLLAIPAAGAAVAVRQHGDGAARPAAAPRHPARAAAHPRPPTLGRPRAAGPLAARFTRGAR